MSFNDLIKNGIDRVYAEDMKSQKHFIDIICNDIRNMSPDIVYKARGFVVPNEQYMMRFFGDECLHPDYDIYDFDGNCNWQEHLVFGIPNLANQIVGLVGYNFITRMKNEQLKDWSKGYYKYSQKKVFDRGKYIFIFPEVYKKAIEEGYIILTDGVFDMLSFVANDFNAGALLGSLVNEIIIAQLKFIPRIFLAVDNDDAGEKLLKSLKMYLPQVRYIKQNITKDSDDFFKTDKADILRKSLRSSLENKTKMNLLLRF